jgi:hypothetical protein
MGLGFNTHETLGWMRVAPAGQNIHPYSHQSGQVPVPAGWSRTYSGSWILPCARCILRLIGSLCLWLHARPSVVGWIRGFWWYKRMQSIDFQMTYFALARAVRAFHMQINIRNGSGQRDGGQQSNGLCQ